jgi:hypothetical protein
MPYHDYCVDLRLAASLLGFWLVNRRLRMQREVLPLCNIFSTSSGSKDFTKVCNEKLINEKIGLSSKRIEMIPYEGSTKKSGNRK